jgi:hypothetical protein
VRYLTGPARSMWGVPKRNALFTGRLKAMGRLQQGLAEGTGQDVRSGVSQMVVVGLGGVGKTQLATEFCYRCVHSRPSLQVTTLHRSFSSCCVRKSRLQLRSVAKTVQHAQCENVGPAVHISSLGLFRLPLRPGNGKAHGKWLLTGRATIMAEQPIRDVLRAGHVASSGNPGDHRGRHSSTGGGHGHRGEGQAYRRGARETYALVGISVNSLSLSYFGARQAWNLGSWKETST